jgi:hypothetical protein
MSENNQQEDQLEEYGDSGITSADAKVAPWLKITYITLPIWGIIWFYMYWNGTTGWLDRGYWEQLQRAANTTFPSHNINDQ